MALAALQALLRTVYADVESQEDIKQDKASKLAQKLCDTCLLELKEPDKSNATPATKILAAAVSASGWSADAGLGKLVLMRDTGSLASYTVPRAFAQILNGFRGTESIHQHAALFKVTAQLLKNLRSCPVERPAEPLVHFREELLSMCTSNLGVQNTRSNALEALVQLCHLPGCLDGDELVFALQSLTNLLVKPDGNGSEDIAEELLHGLRELAAMHPRETEDNVMPALFGLLPDSAPSKQDLTSIGAYKLGLACLTSLATVQPLFETLLIRLLARVDSALAPRSSPALQYSQDTLYAHHLLTTLRIVLERKVHAGHNDVAGQAERICSRLYGRFVQPAVSEAPPTRSPAIEPRLIEDAGKVIMLLVQQLDQRYVFFV